ncbi:MAG TPA: TetR/AcrR family transcriptional regulator [Acidimicrobiales bacterium]|jgi:AcrR family transcriptional regulator
MTTSERRKYDSPVRRQQAAETRERILAAGSELVHGFPRWDWRELTVRAVAQRAGVNERTVYRHFSSERELHEAVIRRLQEEVGDPLDGLTLEGFGDVVAQLFDYLASFAASPRQTTDPTFVAVDERRRQALVAAVEPGTGAWSDADREMAAALLDALWSVPTYERLVAVWGLDTERATQAVTGLIHLLVEAIQSGRRPWLNE